jgi:hypothetical protein
MHILNQIYEEDEIQLDDIYNDPVVQQMAVMKFIYIDEADKARFHDPHIRDILPQSDIW